MPPISSGRRMTTSKQMTIAAANPSLRREPRMPGRRKSDSETGLTLIELLIVIAILSLTMGVVTVRLDSVTSSSRLKASARRIGSSIEYLQNQGIVNGRYYFMQFDLDRNRVRFIITPEYTREGMDVEGLTRDLPWKTLERGVIIEDITFDDGVVKEEDLILVPFGPTGMTWGFLVHLINEDGRRCTVEANSVTGLVAQYPYYKELDEIPEEIF